MGVEALLAVLEQRAAEEAERRRAEAEAEADAIRREAEAEVERRRAGYRKQLEAAARARLAQELAAAWWEARRAVLEHRARLFDRVFAGARERLASLPLPEYADRLGALLAEALPYLEGEAVVIECQPEAAPLVRRLLGDRTDLSVVADPAAAPGLMLRSADGRVEIDQTLPGRLERLRDELAVALSQRLGV
jgi:vacuolar-type H+-ATPase subunit E/Vma4